LYVLDCRFPLGRLLTGGKKERLTSSECSHTIADEKG